MFGQAQADSQNLLDRFKKKNIDSLVKKVSVKLKDSSIQEDPMYDENGRFISEFKNEKPIVVEENKIIKPKPPPTIPESTNSYFCYVCVIFIPYEKLHSSKVQIIKVYR